MRLISTILLIAVALLAAVHFFFWWSTGTAEPCRAAVLRIIQRQRDEGKDLAAAAGVLFARQLEDSLRAEGVTTCYRAALRGEAPELVNRIAPR